MAGSHTRAARLALVLVLAFSRLAAAQVNNYVVGPQDVLTIMVYDQPELNGKYSVEADGTFTYPLIGRVTAGGLTLRALEASLNKQLIDDGFFKDPQVSVAVEQYRSQRVFIVGEVRNPGTYALTGDMTLIEALARAGSTSAAASGEALIVHPADSVVGPTLPTQPDGKNVERVNLRDLEKGVFSQNTVLHDGDTIIVSRAETVYVFGQVKSPGAYALQQKNTSILQALSLAGGVTDRGSTSRVRIVRVVNGEKKEVKVKLSDVVQPNDTIIVGERFF